MKIKIIDWNEFEKKNAIYFTRDINIENEFDVFVEFKYKKKKYYIFYVDFISFQKIVLIQEDKYYEVVEKFFSEEYVFKKRLFVKYDTEEDCVNVQLDDVIAKKWIIEDPSFLGMIFCRDNMSLKIFREKEL